MLLVPFLANISKQFFERGTQKAEYAKRDKLIAFTQKLDVVSCKNSLLFNMFSNLTNYGDFTPH